MASTQFPLSPNSIQPITSPAPSHTSLSSQQSSKLPLPRRNPLRAGSAKEDAARRYVEGRLLGISRRYVKKFQDLDDQNPDGEQWGSEMVDGTSASVMRGYTGFTQAADDLSEVVDVLWLSGTPSLQIPYLLNVALSAQAYLTSFPFTPRSTFALLRKLDHAFASLIKGMDIDSQAALPGFGIGSKGMSRTDMVRVKGIVEGTRVVVVELAATDHEEDDLAEPGKPEEFDSDDDDLDGGPIGTRATPDAETEEDEEMQVDAPEEGENDMDVARVYERTLTALGEALGSTQPFDAYAGV